MTNDGTRHPANVVINADRLRARIDDAERLERSARRAHAIQRAVGHDWYRFWSWCDGRGLADEALPATPHALAAWLRWALEHLDDDTVVATLAAIREHHDTTGHGAHLSELGA
jgi:hypothetical protein